MSRYDLYSKLREAYSKAYPTKSKNQIHHDVITIWNEHKKKADSVSVISEEIRILEEKFRKRDANFRGFWANLPQPSHPKSSSDPTSQIALRHKRQSHRQRKNPK